MNLLKHKLQRSNNIDPPPPTRASSSSEASLRCLLGLTAKQHVDLLFDPVLVVRLVRLCVGAVPEAARETWFSYSKTLDAGFFKQTLISLHWTSGFYCKTCSTRIKTNEMRSFLMRCGLLLLLPLRSPGLDFAQGHLSGAVVHKGSNRGL